jgi:acyl carrier protein
MMPHRGGRPGHLVGMIRPPARIVDPPRAVWRVNGSYPVDVADEVKRVIAKALKIPAEQLTDETRLEDLGAESLDVIEMVFELEETFDITISLNPDPESRTFSTVGDVVRAVTALVEAKAGR